jgi:hypothetical protein
MDYLIFSDESGCWNEGDFYLRSWIKISPKNYEALRKDIIFLKHETGIKELKWKSFKNNLKTREDTIASIFNIDFNIFVTISIPGHFQNRLTNNRYIILRTLQEIKPEQSTGGEQLTEAIKNKIISAAQHTIFYSFFEKQHIENAKKALINDIPTESYQYIVDTPQCLDRDWIKIANECRIGNIKIEKKSEKVSGIELADIIAGCIHEYLRGEEQAGKCYKEYIKNKMLDMRSKAFPNPNLIFFEDFNDDEKKKTNIFR